MVEEAGVTVHREYHPTSVDRDGRELDAATFESFDDEDELRLEADAFVDATYEGDLAAAAGVPYRLGRESRDDFGEQYAGR
ncbi:MAG: FAD-dependent oxidoreductase, partial [Halobacteria archaeon]|nr:FAD-dependent oxidoreductase [Halobacteria archaeon]